MFWIDDLAKQIIGSKDKKQYQINDYKTPSGRIHIGALRGVIIHESIRLGLIEKKKFAKFTYGFDDFDPMDGFPKNLDISFKKYMGMPLSEVPSPNEYCSSYAEYFALEFLKVFEHMGIKPEIIWTSQLYKSGQFNESIKIALNNASKIQEIYHQISGSKKQKNWYPFQAICQNCGKIGTTTVFDYKNDMVYYKCEPNMVSWAKGCGHVGKVSPYNGNGKLPWKVEWPAKWYIFKNDVEASGKDHMTKTGSFAVASQIARKIFHIEPPFAPAYEWFLMGGAKMSTSKGVGASAFEISQILPPEILRFLNVRTHFKKTIDFNPEGVSVPVLFDLFIDSFKEYKKDKNSDIGRAYYYSKFNINDTNPEYLMRFSKIAYSLQMPRIDIYKTAAEEKGSALTKTDKKYLNEWIKYAKKWLKSLAPDDFKFDILEKAPKIKLNPDQVSFLKKVLALIELDENLTGEKLHQQIHDIKTEQKIDARAAFSAIYSIFLGKDSGPQAGWFLANLDKKFAIQRIKKFIN